MIYTLYAAEGIGTHWRIDLPSPIEEQKKDHLVKKIAALIETYDQTLSRFRSDSLIMSIAQSAGTLKLPPYAIDIIKWYERMYQVTHGLVTPLIAQMLIDAGYDASYSLKPIKPLTAPPPWNDVIEYDEHARTLTLKKPLFLDFGAAGKGHLIDLVIRLLRDEGYDNATIDAGGDILHMSRSDKLRVGLEHPDDFSKVIGLVEICNESICASAGSRRKWGSYHHILNPHTLTCVRDIIATWVIAPTAMQADGIATCLFFTPPEELTSLGHFEYLMLDKDMRVARSPGFRTELY